MAKIRLGALAGAVSGSIGTWVFAHNRGGAYIRNRATPDTFTSPEALAAKSRLATQSQLWQSLDAAGRLSWQIYANQNPIVDSLGEKRLLTGHQAFVGINTRLSAAGQTIISVPPSLPAPMGFDTMTMTSVEGGDTELTFSPALSADEMLWVRAVQVSSPAINFVKNLLKFCGVSAKAATSPADITSLIEGRIGSAVVDHAMHVWIQRLNTVTGLLGPVISASTIVTT